MSQWDDPSNRETRAYPSQQAGYGQQPGYEQQPPPSQQRGRRRYQDSTANPFGAASDQAFGIVSTVLALLGAILGIVTLTGLEWFNFGGRTVQFGDVYTGPQQVGFTATYFAWLAWTALIVAAVAGVAASFPSPALRAFRVIGVVIAFAMAGLSFLALQLDARSYTEVIKHTRIGFYLMVIAYILIGIGAAIGPRRV